MTHPNYIDHDVPTGYSLIVTGPARPITGIVLHNTVTQALAAPHSEGSWHWEIDRNGSLHRYVEEQNVAYHVRAADRNHPAWIVPAPGNIVSDVNWCTIGIELVSFMGHPDCPADYEPYTDAQYAMLVWLLEVIQEDHGPLPVVGHGYLQRDRSDPVALDWSRTTRIPKEIDEMAALTPEQRELAALADQGITKAVIDTYFSRAAELGRELLATKPGTKQLTTLTARRRREIGAELSAFA